MATYSKTLFNAGNYSAFRPTYPRALYEFLYRYHQSTPSAQWKRVVDLGCGPGQATVELTKFEEIIGVDPSEAMITKAKELLKSHPSSGLSKITYVKGQAENLEHLEAESVDMVVTAQAAHWFNYDRLWPQLARVLRKEGTVALWGYSQFRIDGHPYLTPLIHEYSKGSDPINSIGPYWEEPGRSILDNHYLDIPKAPTEYFKNHEHIFWTGDYHPNLPSPKPILLRKRGSWESLQAYLRTFSSLFTYHEAHPNDKEQFTGLSQRPASGHGEKQGDIVERLWWTLKETVAKENNGDEGSEIEIVWPTAMLLFKKK
ncbi:hypothetical protein Clacol_007138 [Clathrus columnatus]|uniref:Methyltransferase type 11 domain-containing protein n=1 Tax=Clathrus columnatus TaxID=1419009 RepID=A0AAV5AGP3_9AGAM|nr:hypothetical protein Clacol_007138 [Clathrus columnatus]